MQKKAPSRRLAVASFPVVLWFATLGIAAPESRLELRGEIVLSPTIVRSPGGETLHMHPNLGTMA